MPDPIVPINSSTVSKFDYDQDGDIDLFVGEDAKLLNYGQAGNGYILENNGQGHFKNISESVAPGLAGIGMITDSATPDIDGDGDQDLLIVGEFMGIEIFENRNGIFEQKSIKNLSTQKGWWNSILAQDLDGDGDVDFVIGNHGLNSRFKASDEYPVALFVSDFDKNGITDPILSKYRERRQSLPLCA